MTSTCSGCYATTFDLPSLNKSVPNPLHEGFPGRRGTISQVDILRAAGSLKVGTVHASTLVQALQRGGHPTTLGRAIAELGRIPKTLHLLNYIDDDYYRRRIQTQLNRGEGRHSVARHVFHGQRGELRQRYRQ